MIPRISPTMTLLPADRQRIAYFFPTAHRFDRWRRQMPLMALGGSFTAVFPTPSPPSSRSVTLPETSQISREIGAAPLDHRPLAPSARDALPPACAGGSRHEPASNVSVPADIQGGDAVSEETPSGL